MASMLSFMVSTVSCGARSVLRMPASPWRTRKPPIALLADGVPADKLYPIDMDRAFHKLDEIKPHITVWWTTGAQPAQLLLDKEVVMATG